MGWMVKGSGAVTLGVAAAVLASLSGCSRSGAAPTAGATPSAASPGMSVATAQPTRTPGAVVTATPSAVSAAVVYGCDEQPVSSPATFTLACGDGKVSLGNLVWSNWGQPTASATGKYLAVSCVPNCASGTEVPYTATVTVGGLSNGSYTVMHISAPQAPSPTSAYRLDARGPVEAH